MSLFGIIPISEIKELASKCEKYMQKFLEDRSEKKDEGTAEPNNKDGETPDGENLEGDPKDVEDAKSANNVQQYSISLDVLRSQQRGPGSESRIDHENQKLKQYY